MNLSLTEEQKMLRTTLREFLEKEITPIASERDAKGALTKEELREYVKKLMPFGFYIGALPEENGGADMDHKTCGMIYEELARSWAGLAGAVNLTDVGMFHHLFFGVELLRDKYQDRIM